MPINNCQFAHFYKIISSIVTIYAVFFNKPFGLLNIELKGQNVKLQYKTQTD